MLKERKLRRYMKKAKLPYPLYIDDLFVYLFAMNTNKEYYVDMEWGR